MSETPSSAQRSASVAKSANDQRLHLRLVAGGIIFALALAVVMLRLSSLDRTSARALSDEGAHGVDALRVLQGEHAVFFPENYGREGMIVYAVAVAISFWGARRWPFVCPRPWPARARSLSSSGWGGCSLEEMKVGGPPRGAACWSAALGPALLAVSIGQTVLGRTAFRVQLPATAALSESGPAVVGMGTAGPPRRKLVADCAGWRVRGAVGVHLHAGAFRTPFLFLLYGLSFLLPPRSGARTPGRECGRHPWARLRAALPSVFVFLAIAGLVAAPLFVYFALHPEHFFMRGRSISVFAPGLSQGDSLALYLLNVWEHLLAFGFRGDGNWRHNFAGRPMLNPWEAAFFWLGVGMAVWRWQRRPAYRLLLLWLAVLFLPATLARDSVPNTLRMIGAVPAIYLLVAVGVWETFRILRERYGALQGRAGLIFRENWTRAAIAMAVMVGGLILVQGVTTYRN